MNIRTQWRNPDLLLMSCRNSHYGHNLVTCISLCCYVASVSEAFYVNVAFSPKWKHVFVVHVLQKTRNLDISWSYLQKTDTLNECTTMNMYNARAKYCSVNQKK